MASVVHRLEREISRQLGKRITLEPPPCDQVAARWLKRVRESNGKTNGIEKVCKESSILLYAGEDATGGDYMEIYEDTDSLGRTKTRVVSGN